MVHTLVSRPSFGEHVIVCTYIGLRWQPSQSGHDIVWPRRSNFSNIRGTNNPGALSQFLYKVQSFPAWRQPGSVVRVGDLNAEDPGSNPRLGLLELICLMRWSRGPGLTTFCDVQKKMVDDPWRHRAGSRSRISAQGLMNKCKWNDNSRV